MDKMTKYRRLITRLVNEYASYVPANGRIEPIPVCDRKNDNYLLLHAGWEGGRRVHWTIFHLRLRDGKIWVEEDGVEHGIDQELLDAGVPPQDIVYPLESETAARRRTPPRAARRGESNAARL
jgi:hypothetical protein